jgi:hypothetical protein
MMFNNGLPDSSLFCCISLLCLPHCLSAHMTCAICSSAFYALCAMSIHCTVPLLCNSTAALFSFFTHESPSPTTTTTNSNNNNNPSLLCTVYIWLLCILCMQYSPFLCMLIPCTNILHISSALRDHHRDSSTSLVVQPLCLSSLGVMLEIPFSLWQLRLFVFSVKVELTFSVSVTGLNAHPAVNRLHEHLHPS